MTNPRTPARQAIRDAAEANGWTMTEDFARGATYARGGIEVQVGFTGAGAVYEASRMLDETTVGQYIRSRAGKRETVLAWLTLAPADDETENEPASTSDVIAELGQVMAAAADAAPTAPLVDGQQHAALERVVVELEVQADEDEAIIEGLAAVARRLDDEVVGARVIIEARDARIAELEDELAALETRHAGANAALGEEREARRDAEDRADDAERGQHLAEDRIVELERRAGVQAADWAALRAHCTDLEDAPVRRLARQLVELIVPAAEAGRLTLAIVHTAGLLSDALGLAAPVRGSGPAEDAARPHPALTGDLVTARQVLNILDVQVPTVLPGQSATVVETVPSGHGGVPMRRVLGVLVRDRRTEAEVMRTDEAEGAEPIPVPLLVPYVNALRALGTFAGPERRRTVARQVAVLVGNDG